MTAFSVAHWFSRVHVQQGSRVNRFGHSVLAYLYSWSFVDRYKFRRTVTSWGSSDTVVVSRVSTTLTPTHSTSYTGTVWAPRVVWAGREKRVVSRPERLPLRSVTETGVPTPGREGTGAQGNVGTRDTSRRKTSVRGHQSQGKVT